MYRQRSAGDVSGHQIQPRGPNFRNNVAGGAVVQTGAAPPRSQSSSSSSYYEESSLIDPEPNGNRFYQQQGGVDYQSRILIDNPQQNKTAAGDLSLSSNSDQYPPSWDRPQHTPQTSNTSRMHHQLQQHAPSPPSYIPMPPPNAAISAVAASKSSQNAVRFGPSASSGAAKRPLPDPRSSSGSSSTSSYNQSTLRSNTSRSIQDPTVFGTMQEKLERMQLGTPPKSGMPIPMLPSDASGAHRLVSQQPPRAPSNPNNQFRPKQPTPAPPQPHHNHQPVSDHYQQHQHASHAHSFQRSVSETQLATPWSNSRSSDPTAHRAASSDDMDLSKERKRGKLLAELVSTERTYFESLQRLQTVYLRPLARLMSNAEIDHVTGGATDLEFITELSGNLLQKLETRLSVSGGTDTIPTPSLCDIVRDTIPLFKIYYRYIRNFDTATEKLKILLSPPNKKLSPAALFLSAPETVASAAGLTFNSYLILPIQRLPRYELLLKSLLDSTSRSHADFDATVAAWQSIRSLNQELNHRARLEKARMGASNDATPSDIGTISAIGDEDSKISSGTNWNPSTERLSVFVAVPGPNNGLSASAATTSAFYLRIKIKSARGLTVADNQGYLDPYIVVKTAEGTAHKTAVHRRAGVTAEWNEECLIGFAAGADTRFAIVLKTNDSFMSSTELGRLEMNASELQLGLELDLWFSIPASPKLRKKLEIQTVGEIFLAMLVFD